MKTEHACEPKLRPLMDLHPTLQ